MISGLIIFFLLLILVLGLSMPKNQPTTRANNVTLKLIYIFLIGIFVAVFVGVGIAAFYPEPKSPEYPAAMKYGPIDKADSVEQNDEYRAQMEQYDQEEKAYRTESQIYSRNVSTIALVASIIIVIASLTLLKTILLIADGLLLGGVLTLIYSVMRGFGAEDNMFRFIVVTVGLAISLVLGYVKFIQPTKNI